MNVDEGGLPLLWADRHSPELHCAFVNSPQQPVNELYAIHKMPRDFCQALLLRIDQNSSGEAMYYPGFVSWRTVVGIGAKIDTEKIFLDSIIVVNKSFRHQAHELLELDLILGLRLFQLQQ